MTDWLAWLETPPSYEPYASIAAAWKADRAEIARLRGLLREVVAKRRTILPLDLIDRIDTAMAANCGDSGNG